MCPSKTHISVTPYLFFCRCVRMIYLIYLFMCFYKKIKKIIQFYKIRMFFTHVFYTCFYMRAVSHTSPLHIIDINPVILELHYRFIRDIIRKHRLFVDNFFGKFKSNLVFFNVVFKIIRVFIVLQVCLFV